MTTFSPSWEPAMRFEGVALSLKKDVVRKFYKEMWDHADLDLIPEIFHEDFTFRGSLGPALVGYGQFADYVRWITTTFGSYTSDILGMLEEGDLVSAKLRFHGIHEKEVFGIPPSGERVWWYGAPVFTFRDEKVCDLWVLGDIYGLISRMKDDAPLPEEFKTSKLHRSHPCVGRG